MRWALYVTVPPAWFDPGDVVGVITPFWILYALHDALVKPMPGNHLTPSLAESWTVSADQKVYEFKLRQGVKFHNGDPFTAEDVKFSFHRAKAKLLHEKVKDVVIADPHRVRFVLHEPWPDFMTFYGTFVSGAGWVVPKKYIEQVGVEGFRKHPIGLGPYKFVSINPGIELVMEAYEGYWRKMPSVKRLVYKSVPDATTRLAMLKRGEVDLAYLIDVPMAEDIKRDPTLKLAFSGGIGTTYLDFLDMWDPKSPWADKRVRQAASLAIDRRGLSEAETVGRLHSHRQCGAARASSSPSPSSRTPTIPRGPGSSSPRPGTRRGSTRAICTLAALYLDGGDGDQLPRRHRHQDAGAHHGAGGLLYGPGLEEAQGALRVHQRRVRQCGLAPVRDRARRGQLRLRRLAGHRGALRPAGARDRSEEARGHAPADPAAAQRARALRAHLRLYLAERGGAAGGGARAHADQPVSLVGSPRGSPPQEMSQETRRSPCSRCG